MRYLSIILITTLTFSFFSCQNIETDNPEPIVLNNEQLANVVENDIHYSSLKISRYDESLVDRIYARLLEKDQSLAKLDDQVNDLAEYLDQQLTSVKAKMKLGEEYYQAALNQATYIQDSILDQKMTSILQSDYDLFRKQTEALRMKAEKVDSLENLVYDKRKVMKLRLTNKVVKEYLKGSNETTLDFEDLTEDLKSLMNNLDLKEVSTDSELNLTT